MTTNYSLTLPWRFKFLILINFSWSQAVSLISHADMQNLIYLRPPLSSSEIQIISFRRALEAPALTKLPVNEEWCSERRGQWLARWSVASCAQRDVIESMTFTLHQQQQQQPHNAFRRGTDEQQSRQHSTSTHHQVSIRIYIRTIMYVSWFFLFLLF